MPKEKAVRQQMKLLALLTGVEGSGKTLSGMKLLYYLTEGKGNIGVIDTEHKRSMLYAPPPERPADVDRNWFEFYQYPLTSFSPENYAATIEECLEDGMDAIMIDSLTHEWEGKDGILESGESETEKTSFFSWKQKTKRHNDFLSTMLRASERIHILCTARTKADYIIEGKTPKKIGTAIIQRETTPFEFTLIGDMNGGQLTVTKATNADGLVGKVFDKPGVEFAALVNEWLGIGADMPIGRDEFIAQMIGKGYKDNAAIAEFVKQHPECTGTYRYEKLLEIA